MKILLSLLTIFTALLLIPSHALASNPAPLQISPINNEMIYSTKLEWLSPDYELKADKPYRIQVDSSADFIDPLKDYLTNSTNYAPILNPGIWYWRILAKDLNSMSSEWSPAQQFIYTNIIPSPSPTPEPQIFFTPTPTPTILPTSLPSPTIQPSTPTSSAVASTKADPTPSPIFNIRSLPSQIDSNQSFQNFVTLLLPQSPNTTFYLKGAFYEDGSSNYFGQTKYLGNWIKNSQTFSGQFKIQTDIGGRWQGFIEFIPDSQDSGFSSSGEYNFKVARYSSTGLGPTWSNSESLYINEIIPPSPSPSPSPLLSPSPSANVILPTPSPKITAFEDLTEASLSAEEIEASESALDLDPQIASIEGIATTSGELETSTPLTAGSKINPSWFYLSSGLLFLAGLGSTFIVKYKPHLKIKQWLSKHNQPEKPKNLPGLWQQDFGRRAE